MSGFRFGLQRLLDLRSRSEDEARVRLADSQRQVFRTQDALVACESAWEQAARCVAAQPGAVCDGDSLLGTSLHLAHLCHRRAAHQQQLLEQTRQEHVRRQELLAAARERQVLDRLKLRRWHAHVTSQKRAQQRLLDEAGLLSYLRSDDAG